MGQEVKRRQLFGGSISALVPENFLDVSQLRSIPDNQEVFVDKISSLSLIVEIVEYQTQVENDKAAEFHFKDIGTANDASEFTLIEKSSVSIKNLVTNADVKDTTAYCVIGQQRVAKFNSEALNNVTLELAVIRIKDQKSEILISLNNPENSNGTLNFSETFLKVVSSFKIENTKLFG